MSINKKKTIKKGPLGAALGAIGGSLLGPPGMVGGAALGSAVSSKQQKEDVPVQKILGGLLGMLGLKSAMDGEASPMSSLDKNDVSMQKWIAPLAIGALGGKLLGLSKKEDVPIQNILPVVGLAARAIGPAIGRAAKAAGPPIGRAAKAGFQAAKPALAQAGKTGLTTAATTYGAEMGTAGAKKTKDVTGIGKSQLTKHKTRKLHSHKRNPFSSRKTTL